MTLEEIKKAVDEGKSVFWHNTTYQVIKDNLNQYLIHCKGNDTYIGLTWVDGITLNGKEKEFFIKD